MAKDKNGYLLRPREVTRLLHVHANTLKRWSDEGRIRAYRINHRGDRRFRRADIERFLAEFDAHKGFGSKA